MSSHWSQIYSSHLPRRVKRLPSKFCCIGIGISCTANFFANIDNSSQIKTWLRVTDRGLNINFIYEVGSKALNTQWRLNIECSILLWLPRCYRGLYEVFFMTFLFSMSLGSLRTIWRSCNALNRSEQHPGREPYMYVLGRKGRRKRCWNGKKKLKLIQLE